MAGISLLETKFYIPCSDRQQVARPRLVERLEQDQAAKLTLVSAPAGSGKTTLLAEWIAESTGGSVAWVSLDAGDRHPVSFWSAVITGLQRVWPEVGQSALAQLNAPQAPPIEALLTLLLNEISALTSDGALVLDDYHLIDDSSIHQALAFLIDHQPPQLRLILASRSDPPLPLPRWRVRGELIELRASDLRFTGDEAADFLNRAGLNLAAGDVATLEQRTEGWIAGLQLAALSLKGRSDAAAFITAFSGDNRYVVDYLVEEVLQRQPNHLRNFLLQTSILERLNRGLCNAVTEQPQDPKTLETLERGNLFVVPLDDQRQWYRYHHLFADVLQTHLRSEQPDLLPKLHLRASAWYEQNDLLAEAIHHAIAAEDFERTAGLIEQIWPTMRRRQRETTVFGWIKSLPDALIRDRPVLSVVYALVLLNDGQLDAVESRLQDAERCLEALDSQGALAVNSVVTDEAQLQALPASIANARAYRAVALRDVSSTVTYAQQALALLPEDEAYERGTTAALLGLAYWTGGKPEAGYHSFAEGLAIFKQMGLPQIAIGGTMILAQMSMAQGRLHRTIQICEQSLQLAAEQGDPVLPGTPELYLALSEAHYEQGDLAAARQLWLSGETLRQQASLSGARFLWRVVQACLTAAEGDMETAFDQLHQAEQLYYKAPIPVPNVRPIAALKVRWWLQQGRLVEALDWVRDCGLSVDDEPSYLREYEHLTLARVAIFQYKRDGTDVLIDPVISLLNRLLAAAEAQDRKGSMIQILVVLALANEAQGDIAASRVALERSLDLAEPEGYVRLFVDKGEPMRGLLGQVAAGSYGRRVLAAFGKGGSAPVVAVSVEGAAYVEPLTPREVEVLRLIAAGMRNQEIADQLFISLATVKRHIANAYGKLGVSHRMEAVVRANELNLL